MVVAQKKFLGDMNTNKKYAIMLYLAGTEGPQIKGFGALEHHESTSVVLHEMMPKEAIDEAIVDVVSHEFFHTVNPLKTHSEEIHYFNYADPKCLNTFGCMKAELNILPIYSRFKKV